MPLPTPDSLFYRYDPPIILVNLKLAKDAGDAMASILPEMKKWYKGNSEAVSYRINTSHLASPNPSQLHVVNVQLGGRRKAVDKVTQSFLKTNPLAKIVIVLDTHTVQDGQFITKVTNDSIESDVLGPVRCRSLEIFTYRHGQDSSKIPSNRAGGDSVQRTWRRTWAQGAHCQHFVWGERQQLRHKEFDDGRVSEFV